MSRVTQAGQEVDAVSIPRSAWYLGSDAVTGLVHRCSGRPCQDAVAWRETPRPVMALSDGVGSAAISERGARALVVGMIRFLNSLEDALVPWLDCPREPPQEETARFSRRLFLHASGLLEDLARAECRNVRDLSAALLVGVIGSYQAFWWQIGDGAVVARNGRGLHALSCPAKSKGEFANQTCFVDSARISDVQFGLLPTSDLSGLALMSDGGAERLVAHDGSRVANRIGEWFDVVADRRFSPEMLALAFHEPAMWERTSLDDRAIVLAARPMHG